ncbi:hypothetical protein H9P43_002252 [Blastocladiella emersonii ATCC 22665]|nr:hypothetical protein H9P43_002252 [Blastocladiella emersonii ATCC 22665]
MQRIDMSAASSSSVYTVVVAVDSSVPSLHAFDAAARLVARLAEYRLVVIHCTALNKTSRFPYFDHLDKAYNLEIQDESRAAINECKAYLRQFDDLVDYELVEVEGEGDVGPLIERYLADNVPECDLVVIGTHNHQGLKKMLYASVSQYCVEHLPYPVTVVKAPAPADAPPTSPPVVATATLLHGSQTALNAATASAPTHEQ